MNNEWSVLVGKARTATPGPEMEATLSTIRLSIETLGRTEAPSFLSDFVPWIVRALSQNIPISFEESDWNHRCRLAAIRCINRLIVLEEALKPYLPDICSLLMDILKRDNEECALIALHSIIDIQKSYRQIVESMVPIFLDFVIGLLDSFPQLVATSRTLSLQPAVCSLKIVLECPVIVVLLFQLHRRFINDYIGRFVPVVMKALSVNMDAVTDPYPPSPSADSSTNMERVRFCDFVSAKIKILSFFAYISRGFIAAVRSFANDIPPVVLALLRDTPVEIPNARKELLVAIRHILSTDIRASFFPILGSLLDERILLGEGWTCNVFFRPLAYSLLADLVHYVRLELPQKHLLQVVNLYCRLMIDPSLPASIQTMSTKLLLNLIDPIMGERVERQFKRILLGKILSALLFKSASLSRLITEGLGTIEKTQCPFYSYSPPDAPPSIPSLAINCDSVTTESWREGPKDIRLLFKSLLGTMKAVITSLKNFSIDADSPIGITLTESQSFVSFFSDGLDCLQLLSSYSQAPLDPKASRAFSVSSIPAEEKELLDQFAYIFTLLELPHFYDIVERSMGPLVTAIRHNFALLAIPQYFLAISGLSRHFSAILARFLTDRMAVLGGSLVDAQFGDLDAAIHLRLFKLLFLSVSVYPEENEPVLQPLVGDIIMQCLRGRQANSYSLHVHSIHYFYLLRSLFRSIGGGRFESLYKEVLPLLPIILEELNRLIFDKDSVEVMGSSREVYVELCLTVPVRLSVLLPYLPLLMKPLVLSLSSSNELIGQGLRTLELCVDNLTQDFLDPVITPIADSLLRALWKLLQPSPAVVPAHAQVAMRILGKLGGRSRRFGKLINQPALEPKTFSANTVIALDLGQRQKGFSIELSVDFAVEAAVGILNASMLPINQAFLPDALSIVRHFVLSSVSKVHSDARSPSAYSDCVAPADEGAGHRELLKSCLLALFNAEGLLSHGIEELLSTVFLDCIQTVQGLEGIRSGMAVVDDTRMLIDVLIEAASNLDTSLHVLAVRLIEERLIADSVVRHHSQISTTAQLFFDRLMSFCYESGKSNRPGLSSLMFKICGSAIGAHEDQVPPIWIGPISTRLLRSLLFILKDTASSVSVSVRTGSPDQLVIDRISQSVYRLLKACMQISLPVQATAATDSQETRLQASISQSVTVLVAELSCPNAIVRDVVQTSFQLIADSRGIDVSELLLPFKDRFLPPIFTKPLRALPFTMQIGHIDAVTFCLSLRPPLIGWSEELLRMLQEVLALAETDDHNLLGKSGQLKNTAILVGLRVVCIRFLATCIPISDLQNPRHAVIRNHIVSVFFKALYSRSPEVLEVAKKGLELVVANQSKLPKDLLQLGLRPVLMNLAEARRLTLAGLEGLSRVLQLLTSYFKAEIGRKLLDHLAVWADPKVLEEGRSRHLFDINDIKIITAIISVFPLLPVSANVFVGEMIKLVADLEVSVERRASSPFRPPLFTFLHKYPVEAAEALCDNFGNPAILSFYSELLYRLPPSPASAALSKEWMGKAPRVVSTIAQPSQPPLVRLEYLKILVGVALQPGRLLCNAKLFRDLIGTLWSNIDGLIRKDATLILSEEEVELLMSLSKLYVQCNPNDAEFVFAWLALLRPPLPVDPSFLPRFLSTVWLPLCSQTEITKALRLWVSFSSNQDVPSFSKALVTRLIAVPIVNMSASSLDPALLAVFKQQIWLKDGRSSPAFAIAELQLTAALLQSPNLDLAKKLPKELSDFFLNRAALQDPVVKLLSLSLYSMVNMSSGNLGSVALRTILKSANLETRGIVKNALLGLRSMNGAIVGNLKEFLEGDAVGIPPVLSIWMAVCEEPGILDHQLAKSLILSFSRFGQAVMAVPEQKMFGPKMLHLAIGSVRAGADSVGILQTAVNSLVKLSPSFMDNSADSEAARTNAILFLEKAFSMTPSPELLLADCDLTGLERLASVNNPTGGSNAGNSQSSQTLNTPGMTPGLAAAWPEDEFRTVVTYAVRLFTPLVNQHPVTLLTILSHCPRLFDAILSFPTDCALQHVLVQSVYRLSGQFALLKGRVDQLLTDCLNGVRLSPVITVLIQEELQVAASPETLVNSLYRLMQKLTKDLSVADPIIEAIYMDLMKTLLVRSEPYVHLKAGIMSTLTTVWTRPGLYVCHRDIIKILRESFVPSGAATVKLAQKDCVDLMLKSAEAICSSSDREIVRSFYSLIATVYSECPQLRSSDALSVLQPVFLSGLLERDVVVRAKMQGILLATLSPSLGNLACQVLVGLDWSQAGARFWLRSFVSVVLEYFCRLDTSSDPVHFRSRVLFDPNYPVIPSSPSQLSKLAQSVQSSGLQFLASLSVLVHHSDALARSLFVSLFPSIWSLLSNQQRADLDGELVKMLSKPELAGQRYMRPNVPETILEASVRISVRQDQPTLKLSPQLVRYLSQNFCGWYSGIELLEHQCDQTPADQEILSEASGFVPLEKAQVALSALYERLADDDMGFGLLRRRAVFPETVISLSLAHSGQWPAAQAAIESTLQKARNGAIGYLSSEYSIWEKEWYECTKMLQQWELVGEVSKIDGDPELQLEAAWHSADWSTHETQNGIYSLLKHTGRFDVRKKVYEGLLLLEQLKDSPDKLPRFHSVIEEAMSIGMKEWWMLPSRPSGCHSEVLESFQSIVELQEAQLVFANLSVNQSAHSRQPFMQELKGLLGTWRDRLPNHYDKLSVWSDLLAWRQHVYSALSNAFHSVMTPTSLSSFSGPIDSSQMSGNQQSSQSSQFQQTQSQPPQVPQQQPHPLAFRGYHETAWLINRFAKVCRKNGLLDVCLSTLNRIYTLPNIEIQDAFLKLREQTKCYMTEAMDLPLALEVVNATNLNYFNSGQKAEFFTLKAIVYMRLGMLDEANRILAQSVQIDLNLPKGWAVWAGYNDLRFQQSNDRTYAVNAINCYLQAASLHKSAKCRKFLARVLWLSTFEDDAGSVLKPFELYAAELPVWYWLFFIPQLVISLNRKEYRQARYLLIKIAKTFPQALYASLRAAIEDFRQSPSQPLKPPGDPSHSGSSGVASPPIASSAVDDRVADVKSPLESPSLSPRRSAAEESDDIMAILKTAYPLLTLSIENLVDHLVNRLRASPDEDLFRILTTLHTEANQQLSLSIGTNGSDDVGTPFRSAVDSSLRRVSFMISSFPFLNQRYESDFEAEFITCSPSLPEIVKGLRRWKNRLEETVAGLPSSISIDTLSRYLSEFEHQKYDDVEVPGQYLTLFEGHADFVRIAKIHSTVKIVKRHGTSYRRITFIGHDGSKHGFLVQNPVARNGRREERLLQFFRLLNGPMARKLATKRRNLEFTIPAIIPISSHARLVKDDIDTVTFDEVISRHVRQNKFSDPVQLYIESLIEYGKSEGGYKRGVPLFMVNVY